MEGAGPSSERENVRSFVPLLLQGRWMWHAGSRGEENKLLELWNWRGSKWQRVVNKACCSLGGPARQVGGTHHSSAAPANLLVWKLAADATLAWRTKQGRRSFRPSLRVCVFFAMHDAGFLWATCAVWCSVMRSPGADFPLRQEVLVYSYLTLFLTLVYVFCCCFFPPFRFGQKSWGCCYCRFRCFSKIMLGFVQE